MKKSREKKMKVTAMVIAVLLIAAVVITYSITVVAYLF